MTQRSKAKKKTQQKTFAGIPMNWDWKNWSKGLWNPKSATLFPPKPVGIGWTINFHALLKKLRVLKK